LALGLLALPVLVALLLWLSLQLPSVQARIFRELEQVVSDTLTGTLVLKGGSLRGVSGVEHVEAQLLAPDGQPVVTVDGLSGSVAPWPLLKSLISSGPLHVEIIDLEVAHLDLDLSDVSSAGEAEPTLRLVHAVTPTAPPSEPDTSKGIRVLIGGLELDHAWVHRAQGSPPLDADLTDLAGSFRLDETIAANVEHAGLHARALPEVQEARGTLSGSLVLPREPVATDSWPRSAKARFDGTIGGIESHASVDFDEGELDATAWGRSSEAVLRQYVPDLAPEAQTDFEFHARGPLDRLDISARVASARTQLQASGALACASGSSDCSAEVRLVDSTLDLHQLGVGDAPAVLRFSAGAKLEDVLSTPTGSFQLSSHPVRIAGVQIPATELDGTLEETVATARGTIFEPGIPIRVYVRASLDERSPRFEVEAKSEFEDGTRISRANLTTPCPGTVQLSGWFEPKTKRFSADVKLEASALSRPSFSAEEIKLRAHAEGTTERPRLDAKLEASHVEVLDVSLTRVRAQALGEPPALALSLDATGRTPATKGAPLSVHAEAMLASVSPASPRPGHPSCRGSGCRSLRQGRPHCPCPSGHSRWGNQQG
jgi:hypothetical protein